MNNWIEVGAMEDIPKLGARVVETPDGNIGIFRTGENEIFALRDRCPIKAGRCPRVSCTASG